MIPALLSPQTTPFLLGALLAALILNLIALTIIAGTLSSIRNHLAFLGGVNSEVLKAWTLAQADACSDEVEQQQFEGEAGRRVA